MRPIAEGALDAAPALIRKPDPGPVSSGGGQDGAQKTRYTFMGASRVRPSAGGSGAGPGNERGLGRRADGGRSHDFRDGPVGRGCALPAAGEQLAIAKANAEGGWLGRRIVL